MPAPFPLIKLGSILVKQISKPIANFAKERAKSHPFFRTYVCMPPAQLYNWCEIKLKMWVLNLGKPISIPVLSEAMAIELGANLLGEGIVFTIAAGVLIAEYTRSSNKEAAKEQARKNEMSDIVYQLQELHLRAEQQDAKIRELNRTIADYESKRSKFGTLYFGSKDKSADKPPPSAPPAPPITVPISNTTHNTHEDVAHPSAANIGVILAAVQMVEADIVGTAPSALSQNGFLADALVYIERELYETPVAV